jgi:hypothetical protein
LLRQGSGCGRDERGRGVGCGLDGLDAAERAPRLAVKFLKQSSLKQALSAPNDPRTHLNNLLELFYSKTGKLKMKFLKQSSLKQALSTYCRRSQPTVVHVLPHPDRPTRIQRPCRARPCRIRFPAAATAIPFARMCRSPRSPAVPASAPAVPPRPQSIHAQHAVIHAGRGILAPRAGRNPSPLVLEGRLICAPKIHAHSMGSTTVAAALQGFNPRRTLPTTTPHIDTRASSAIHKWSTFVGDPLPCSSPFYPLP